MRIFGREPAYWLALGSALIALVSALFWSLTGDQQGLLNAGVAAVLGIATAWTLKGERLVAAIVGFFKAAIAIALAFNLDLAPEVQSSAMLFVELILTGFLVRPNVIAPIPMKVAVAGPDGAHDITTLTDRKGS
jgi:hypothetical protein